MTWLGHLLSSLVRPFQWWVVVAPWEGALRVRLGRVAAVLEPGIHLRIPFLDRIYRESLRLRCFEETGITVSAADGRVVVLSVAVVFRIADLELLFQTLATPEEILAARVVSELVATVRRENADLEPGRLAGVVPAEEWGLADVSVSITSYAVCRAFRLIGDGGRDSTEINVHAHDQELAS